MSEKFGEHGMSRQERKRIPPRHIANGVYKFFGIGMCETPYRTADGMYAPAPYDFAAMSEDQIIELAQQEDRVDAEWIKMFKDLDIQEGEQDG
jgi:hypothetical protein